LLVTLPANSRNTLADANGCQMTVGVSIVLPPRMLRRPISLMTSLVVTIPGIGSVVVPGLIKLSTEVLE
jgi:hypothetical protein